MERNFIEQSDRIGLSILRKEDVPEILRMSTDPETNRYLNVRWRVLHLEDEYEWYESLRKSETQRIFVIVLKEEDRVIGFVLMGDIDFYNRNCHIGYVLSREYWRKGIATEAVELLKIYGFRELNLRKFYTSVFETNLGSIRVLEKTGFRNAGRYTSHVYVPEKGFVDMLLFELLNEQAL